MATKVLPSAEDFAALSDDGQDYDLVLETAKLAEVHRPGQAPVRVEPDDTFAPEDVLPGFACKVAEFFPKCGLQARHLAGPSRSVQADSVAGGLGKSTLVDEDGRLLAAAYAATISQDETEKYLADIGWQR